MIVATILFFLHFLFVQHICQEFQIMNVVWETLLECQCVMSLSLSPPLSPSLPPLNFLSVLLIRLMTRPMRKLTSLYSDSQESCPGTPYKMSRLLPTPKYTQTSYSTSLLYCFSLTVITFQHTHTHIHISLVYLAYGLLYSKECMHQDRGFSLFCSLQFFQHLQHGLAHSIYR